MNDTAEPETAKKDIEAITAHVRNTLEQQMERELTSPEAHALSALVHYRLAKYKGTAEHYKRALEAESDRLQLNYEIKNRQSQRQENGEPETLREKILIKQQSRKLGKEQVQQFLETASQLLDHSAEARRDYAYTFHDYGLNI